MPNIDLSILNQRQTPAFYASSLATRPAFGFAGRIFIDTDSPSTGLYRDTGAAWVQIADPGAGTTGTLQQVTTNGNTTSQGISITAGGLSSNIVTIAANGLGSTTNYIGQTMATNDSWKIYGTGSVSDQGEMVFEVGDNGSSISPNGQRYRFFYNAASSGTSKDVFIVDYDLSYFNTSLGINTDTPTAAFDVHSGVNVIAQLNQTVATNNSLLAFQNTGAGLWRIGNFYNAGSNDFGVFDVIGAIQPVTIKKTTGQVLIGTSTVGSGKLVVASSTGDNGVQIVGASAPSLRIDNAESGPTKRAGLGISTATNNFIQGSADRDFCMFNGSTTASPILFGVYDAGAGNVQEAARISAARNFLIGGVSDAGQKLQIAGNVILENNITINARTDNFGELIYRENAVLKWNLYNDYTNDQFKIGNSGGTILSITQSGNLGLGVTPSAWGAFKPSLQVGSASLSQIANRAYLTANGYFNGTNWTYIDTDFASQYFQQNSQHIWNTAASGTAGNTISFTQAMTLAATGNLLIGTTFDAGQKLQVLGQLNLWGNNSIQTITKTFVSGGSVSFNASTEYGFNLADNINGLVIISISDTTSTSFGLSGVYVGQVINPRGSAGTITLISTTSGAALTIFTVTMSGNNIVVSATSATYPTNTIRASFTFIGGGGIS